MYTYIYKFLPEFGFASLIVDDASLFDDIQRIVRVFGDGSPIQLFARQMSIALFGGRVYLSSSFDQAIWR